MQRLLITFITIFLTSRCIAMNKSDVVSDALVRFHWSESNKMRNNTKYGSDVRRRAAALDGQLATVMKPPFGPFWCKNRRRIVIQSLDYPDIILAVKQRNLKLEQKIKFHVFHAQNDNSSSDRYLRKEIGIINAENPHYDMVMTVHRETKAFDRPGQFYVGLSHPGALDLEGNTLIGRLKWFSRALIRRICSMAVSGNARGNALHLENILNRLMTSIKHVISELLLEKYHVIGLPYSEEIKNLSGFEPSFLTDLQCQFRAIHHRNGSLIDMEWLKPNRAIDAKWLVQGMMYIHSEFHNCIKEILNHRITVTLQRKPELGSLTSKIMKRIKDRDHFEYTKSLEALCQLLNQAVSADPVRMSRPVEVRSLLYGLSEIPGLIAFEIRSAREVVTIGNIGRVMQRVIKGVRNADLPLGSNIAIVVPGDLIPELDLLKSFLIRAIRKVGWEFKCDVRISEI